MSPRPRQRSVILPNGIKPDALPAYVYWDKTGRGRWIWRAYDPQTQRTTAKRIAGPTATLREIWDAYEILSHEPRPKRSSRWWRGSSRLPRGRISPRRRSTTIADARE